jgi:hypothetical protein
MPNDTCFQSQLAQTLPLIPFTLRYKYLQCSPLIPNIADLLFKALRHRRHHLQLSQFIDSRKDCFVAVDVSMPAEFSALSNTRLLCLI